MILSVIIISHNQRAELRRCVDSVLAQNIPFEYEIIISDDRSDDGTFELAKEYAKMYPFITATQCNSDECNPSMTSERASFNRLNGLKYASGKYLIHVDGDDFYTSEDIFQQMVNVLEYNPQCTIACQNYRVKLECQSVEDAQIVNHSELFMDEVISADEFIKRFNYIHNSCCCMRRCCIAWSELLKKNYDDYDIIFVYLNGGNVALINRADFIYCKYDRVTASKFPAVDQQVCWTTEIALMLEFPQYTNLFIRRNLSKLLHLVNLAMAECRLQDATKKHLQLRNEAFIIRCFLQQLTISTKIRLLIAKYWLKLIKHNQWNTNFVYKILYKLIISSNIPNNVFEHK